MIEALPRWIVGTLGVAAVMVVLGGCSSSADGEDLSEPAVDNLIVDNMRNFSLPMDPYKISPVTLLNTTRARSVLFAQCMARFGFQVDVQFGGGLSNWPGNERRYGITDETSARQRGYHPAPASPTAVNPTKGSTPVVTEGYQTVATGEGPSSINDKPVPDGGCNGEARRKIAEGAPKVDSEQLGDELEGQAFARMLQDSRIRAVFAAWSACMKSAGFDYADPMKAMSDPAFATDSATAREIEVATKDVLCKRAVNLINIQAAVESAYQKRVIEANTEALGQVREWLETQERNAVKVLETR